MGTRKKGQDRFEHRNRNDEDEKEKEGKKRKEKEQMGWEKRDKKNRANGDWGPKQALMSHPCLR